MEEFNRSNPKKVFSKIGATLFLFVLILLVVQYIFSYILQMTIPNVGDKPWFVWIMTIVSLYLISFPIYLMMMKKIPDCEVKAEKKYSLKEMIMLVFVCFSATYLFNFISLGINALIGFLKGSPVINPLLDVVLNSNIIYSIVVACIMAPIVEEIIFRKVLLNKLVGYGEKTAIIVSSLAFALFHGNLSQFFYAFALGAIFAHITVKSGTIKNSIILHMIINLLGSAIIPTIVLKSSLTLTAIVGFIIMVSIVMGVVLFVKYNKVLFPSLNPQPISEGEKIIKISNALLSNGMILFILASIVIIIYNTFG